MRLYLVQHGQAVDKQTDPDRPLTEHGAQEADAVGAFLSAQRLNVPEVWHSGKTRARQTAETLAGHVAQDGAVQMRDGLAPKDDVAKIAKALRGRDRDLLIVGHLPFLAKLAGLLLAGDERTHVVAFQYAGVVCLESDDEGRWQVRWMVVPQLAQAGRRQ